METEVIHTTRKGKSILLFFPLILNYSVGSRDRCISHTNSYNNAITQCHVDGNQRAWATCGWTHGLLFREHQSYFIFIYFVHLLV